MGEYGRVYTTFELTADSGRSGGLVTGEGRGLALMVILAMPPSAEFIIVREPLLQCIPLSDWMTVRKILTK